MARGSDGDVTPAPKRNALAREIGRKKNIPYMISQRQKRLQDLSFQAPDKKTNEEYLDILKNVNSGAYLTWKRIDHLEEVLATRDALLPHAASFRGLLLASLNQRLGSAPIKEAAHLDLQKEDLEASEELFAFFEERLTGQEEEQAFRQVKQGILAEFIRFFSIARVDGKNERR